MLFLSDAWHYCEDWEKERAIEEGGTEKDGWSQRRTGGLGLWEQKDRLIRPNSSTYTQPLIWHLMYRVILLCIPLLLSSAWFSMNAHFMLVCVAVIAVRSICGWVWSPCLCYNTGWHTPGTCWRLCYSNEPTGLTVNRYVSYLVLSKINPYSHEHIHTLI